MDALVYPYPHARVIMVIGVIDAMTQEDLAALINRQVREGAANLVLDLGQVNFMSSAGLRVMIQAVKILRDQNGDLRLAAPQPPVAKMLDLCGMDCLLEVYPSVEEAVRSFNTAGDSTG